MSLLDTMSTNMERHESTDRTVWTCGRLNEKNRYSSRDRNHATGLHDMLCSFTVVSENTLIEDALLDGLRWQSLFRDEIEVVESRPC